MDEVDEAYDTEESGGRKFHWLMPIIRLFAWIASLFGVTGTLFGGFAEDLIEHINYKYERSAFQEDARRELETLTGDPEED